MRGARKRRSLTVVGAALAAVAAGGAVTSLAVGPSERDDAEEIARAAQTRYDRELRPKRGTVRIETRAADPAGGMAWAVRTWVTHDERQFCAQLGRLTGRRFVTVGADGQLREPRRSENTRCSGSVLGRGEPIVAIQTFVDDPQAEEPRPLQTLVWGIAGPNARSVAISRGARARLRLSRRAGGFIAVLDGRIRTFDLAVTVRKADGRTHVLDYGRGRRGSPPREVQLETTVPHPRGGPHVGVLTWTDRRGRLCTYAGRTIAGGRVGSLHPGGIFFDYPVGDHGSCADYSFLTREMPFALSVSYTALEGGELIVQGIAHPDVARVRIDVLGQVRELEPTARRVAIAVFGGVHTGDVRVTVTFKDGSTKEMEPLTFGEPPDFPGQPRVGALGPDVIRVSRDGVATIEVTCPDDRRRRKCIGIVRLETAREYRSPSGLLRKISFGSRLFRIGEGTERRPLRIRLHGRGRTFLERRGSVEAVIVARSDAGMRRPQRRRVTLVAPGAGPAAAASRGSVDVSPATGGLLTIFNVRVRNPYRIRRAADSYTTRLRGPFGPSCRGSSEDQHGLSWHPRYNRRHRILRLAFTPRRIDPEDLVSQDPRDRDLGPWCPGTYRGTVEFRRFLGRGRYRVRRFATFTFTVRGPAPGEQVTVPNVVGLPKHAAECTLLRAHLRWRNGAGDQHPPRYRPRPGCGRSGVRGPTVRSQDPPAGTQVEPGAVVTYETR